MVVGTLIPIAKSDVEVVRPGPRVGTLRLTLADALAMVKAGTIPEGSTIELLDGALAYVDRSADGGEMESKGHRTTVIAIGKLARRIDGKTRHIVTQATLVCANDHAPIPDATVLRGHFRDYDGIPTAADAFAVVEVAESSYRKDAGEKLIAYAQAGVPQYVIINLNNHTAEVYTDPDAARGAYRTKVTLAADGTLSLRVGDAETFDVPLAELLP